MGFLFELQSSNLWINVYEIENGKLNHQCITDEMGNWASFIFGVNFKFNRSDASCILVYSYSNKLYNQQF
jgi:hypothetical protein